MNKTPARTLRKLRSMMISERLAMSAFVLGISTLAFLYGVASYHLKLFPYAHVRNAVYALELISRLEGAGLPPGMFRLDSEAGTRPRSRILNANAGPENLLIGGGPYQMTDQCPGLGCLAWIIDRQGHVIHSWDYNQGRLLGGEETSGFSGHITAKKSTRSAWPCTPMEV